MSNPCIRVHVKHVRIQLCPGAALDAAGAKSLGGLILEHLEGLKAAG